MSELEGNEVALFQVLLSPSRHPWPESILRSVTNVNGDSFFVDDREMVSLAGRKFARPLFATIIRVAVHGDTSEIAWSLAHGMAQAFRQFADPSSNELIPF